jgi:hypothetical protein
VQTALHFQKIAAPPIQSDSSKVPMHAGMCIIDTAGN